MGEIFLVSNVSRKGVERDGAITENDLLPSVLNVSVWNGLRSKLEIRKSQDLAKDFGGTASKAEKKICKSKNCI